MISGRLKKVMHNFISLFQSAFVPNHFIADNILLAQVLVKNYHLNSGKPRCAFKVDFKKSFDTLNWNFLFTALCKMYFSIILVDWI